MKVDEKQMQPIWLDTDGKTIQVIDQRQLPHQLKIMSLTTVDEVIHAIQQMVVRGAPLIGVTGAFGAMMVLLNAPADISDHDLVNEWQRLKDARPTAMNLAWAVEQIQAKVLPLQDVQERVVAARKAAEAIAEEEVLNCRRIGEHGAILIQELSAAKNNQTINILTHCNAGWLACVEYGTATAPIYVAFDQGIDIHVWVDETRPLNQGARLTAWELSQYGIKHTVITDNTGGHLMQHGMVDMVIVGTDRSTYTGDVANKIGTYLKALAAKDNNIPFYVALPSSTFDWQLSDGLRQIPIEKRNPDEVRYVQGLSPSGIQQVLVPPKTSPAANYAFDVTPARLVTGFITERGVCDANEKAILDLFPEKRVMIC